MREISGNRIMAKHYSRFIHPNTAKILQDAHSKASMIIAETGTIREKIVKEKFVIDTAREKLLKDTHLFELEKEQLKEQIEFEKRKQEVVELHPEPTQISIVPLPVKLWRFACAFIRRICKRN